MLRLIALYLICSILAAGGVPGRATAAGEWPAIRTEPFASGLDYVTEIASAHDGTGRLFVLEQQGTVRIVGVDGRVLETPFLDIHGKVGSRNPEQGLLGIAFSPTYTADGWFYVDYTDKRGDTVVARFHVSPDPDRADSTSQQILFTVDQPFSNHNGGHLAFGTDGLLYIAMGDGGGTGDPNGNAQRDSTVFGKLLRLDVKIPDAKPAVYAKGLRNPWKFSWDTATGELYIGDVGQTAWEEVDVLPAAAPAGANFGWNVAEGLHCYPPGTPCSMGGFQPPVLEYDHSQGGCAVTGGYVYRGTANPGLGGIYLFSDYCSGVIMGLRRTAGTWESAPLLATGFLVTTFGMGEDGELFLADYREDGAIYRIVSDAPLPALPYRMVVASVAHD